MKLRIRYEKLGKVRFVGTLDVTRIWERALRKASLPIAYSTGFSPRPKLSFGLALPMAAESVAEYVDIELAADVDVDDAMARLQGMLPTGFSVLAVTEKEAGQVSLQEDVVACDWELTFWDSEAFGVGRHEAVEAVAAAWGAPTLLLERERKGERRVDDVRPSIEALAVVEGGDEVVVRARLVMTGRGLRPAELVSVVFHRDATECVRRTLRTEQWIERDGARRELLPLPAAVAAPAGMVGA